MTYDESKKNTVTLISAVLFGTAVFLKQFYFSESGSFQIADLFFAASVAVWFFRSLRYGIRIEKEDRFLLVYLFCIIGINGFYYFKYGSTDYLLYTAYYIFVVLTTLTFEDVFQETKYLNALRIVLEIAMAFQLFLLISGFSREYLHSGSFMGTFNDPNQCAFFAFASFLIIYIISKNIGKGYPIIWYVVGLFIDLKSGSMGSFLGFFIFGYTWLIIKAVNQKGIKRVFIIFILTGVFLAGLILIKLIISEDIFSDSRYRSLANRLSLKINRFFDSDGRFSIKGYIADRGLWLLYDNPKYMLFGAGEGNFMRRFNSDVEVHSSILGPLFYYGLIPWSLWIIWYMKKLHRIHLELLCVYIALAVESFVLMNCRQPMFWMILALAGFSAAKCKTIVYEEKCDGTER